MIIELNSMLGYNFATASHSRRKRPSDNFLERYNHLLHCTNHNYMDKNAFNGSCTELIGGVKPSHWDQLKKSGSSWDSNPGPSGYRPGTLTTELLDLCGRGVQELMLYILRAEFSSQQG